MKTKRILGLMLVAATNFASAQPGPGGFVQRLDKDGDQRVSAQEFDGPQEHFSTFDRNSDGFIAGDEAPEGPPDGTQWVKRLDKDGDGRISQSEFDGPPEHFTDFDKNTDGFIVSDEAPKGKPQGHCKGGKRGDE